MFNVSDIHIFLPECDGYVQFSLKEGVKEYIIKLIKLFKKTSEFIIIIYQLTTERIATLSIVIVLKYKIYEIKFIIYLCIVYL